MSLREESVLQPRVYKVFRVRGTECGRKEHMMADPGIRTGNITNTWTLAKKRPTCLQHRSPESKTESSRGEGRQPQRICRVPASILLQAWRLKRSPGRRIPFPARCHAPLSLTHASFPHPVFPSTKSGSCQTTYGIRSTSLGRPKTGSRSLSTSMRTIKTQLQHGGKAAQKSSCKSSYGIPNAHLDGG